MNLLNLVDSSIKISRFRRNLDFTVFAPKSVGGGGGSNGNCIPADLQGVTLPHHGRDTFKSAEEMRCPYLTLLARAMRQVATCQESRGGPESLKTASTTLHSMTANREFMNCIVESERVGIEPDVYRMDLAIAAP